MSYKIIPSDDFENNVKKLAKKFKKLDQDLSRLLQQLKQDPTTGTPLGNNCYKIRIPNSSIPTGKSGGFRVITLIKVEKDKIVLLTIYSKTEKNTITDRELEAIIGGLEH